MQRKLRELPRPRLCWQGGGVAGRGARIEFPSRVSSHWERQRIEAEHQGGLVMSPNHALHCLLEAAALWEGVRWSITKRREEHPSLGSWAQLFVGQYMRPLSLLPWVGRLSVLGPPFVPWLQSIPLPSFPLASVLGRCRWAHSGNGRPFFPLTVKVNDSRS